MSDRVGTTEDAVQVDLMQYVKFRKSGAVLKVIKRWCGLRDGKLCICCLCKKL